MIESSSTWGTAELERFQVEIGGAAAKVDMIPEEYFHFSALDYYMERISQSDYN